MPKGKKKEIEKVEAVNEQPKAATEQAPVLKEAVKPVLTGWDAAIAESRKLLETPLSPGQAFFESPEGFVMVDEETRGRVWCRQANKGQGLWINSKR
jgi:hypothetical protein